MKHGIFCDIKYPSECVTDLVSACTGKVCIPIVGSANGIAFNHYFLTYKEDNGAVNNSAILYPDCTDPLAPSNQNGHTQSVTANILGYFDLSLVSSLSVSAITIHLEVGDGAGQTVTCEKTFGWKEKNVEIRGLGATNPAKVVLDPFDTNNNSAKQLLGLPFQTPEISVGGWFTVRGGAYIHGCGRIISGFQLGLYRPPYPPQLGKPAVPTYTDLISPGFVNNIKPAVFYLKFPNLPFKTPQSCGSLTLVPTIISSGNLVVQWQSTPCNGGMLSKLQEYCWNSAPLSGRYVIVLEVRDRKASDLTDFPGVISALDQVAVWIDNQPAIAEITKVGNVGPGCGGLLVLSDYHVKKKLSSCLIMGFAWDPPIDPAYPAVPPNDNFDSYTLTLAQALTVLAGQPYGTSRVPPPSWPTMGTVPGVLADWDIIKDLDAGPIAPQGCNSVKLARKERCIYILTLTVKDKTLSLDCGGGGPHVATKSWPIEIYNDL